MDDFADFIEHLFKGAVEPRPVCTECAGSGEDHGLPCLVCDGWGYKRTVWASQTEQTATGITREMLVRQFYGEFKP